MFGFAGLATIGLGCKASPPPPVAATRPPFGTSARTIQFGPSVSIERVDRELTELRALSSLDRPEDRATGQRFLALVPRFLIRCEADDFRRMLRDPSPLIRTMALCCIAFQPAANLANYHLAMRTLANDDSRLPAGCPPVALDPNDTVARPVTVAELAAIVRGGSGRRLLPPLPAVSSDASAEDCRRLLQYCRVAINPTEDATSSDAPKTDVDLDDSPAWRSASLRLAAVANRVTIQPLLEDKSPIVRAAGLVAVARSAQPDAVDVLSLALHDDAHISSASATQLPANVGDLAARLLIDPHFLLPEKSFSPALADEPRRALIVKLLAADGPPSRLNVAVAAFVSDLRAGSNPLDTVLAFTAQRDVATLKALGRGAFGSGAERLPEAAVSAVRTLLIGCIDDPTLDGDARFAAASALTLDDDDASRDALTAAAAQLDQLAPALALGQRFVKESGLRQSMRASSPTSQSATTQAAVSPADRSLPSHPMSFPVLRRDLAKSTDAKHPAAETSALLDQIAATLDEFKSPWDTYADAGDQLEALLTCGGAPLSDALGVQRVQRLVERSRAAEMIVRNRAADAMHHDAIAPTTAPAAPTTPP